MPFDQRERSRFTGAPIYLVRLQRGQARYSFALGDRARLLVLNEGALDEERFEAPGGISRSKIQDSSQRAKNRLTLTLPIDLDVIGWWLPYPSPQRVIVTCMVMHEGDTEVQIEWTGRVVSPKFYDTKVELVCEPSRSVTKSRGSNLRWQRGCPYPLYSQGIGWCNVDPEDHRVTGEAISYDRLILRAAEIAALPVARLAGGFIRWTRADGEVDYRTIMGHLGDTVFLEFGTDSIEPGTEIDFFPGCRHTWEDCGYYENQDNYGGVLTIPIKSPHDGNPVQ